MPLCLPESPLWFHEDAPELGFMNVLSECVATVARRHVDVVPNLRCAPTLLLGSDYAGFHRGARFEVISIIASNLERLQAWDGSRGALRERMLPNQRRMSYKSLNDRQRRLALFPFLTAANQIYGLLFTVAIDRRVKSVFEPKGRLTRDSADWPELHNWKLTTIERALRIIHLGSLLVRGLSGKGQDLLWITDEDEVVANEGRLRTFVKVFATVSSHYVVHQMGHVRIGTTRCDTGRRDIEDFVAICDFAAGSLQDLLSTGALDGLIEAP
jgi:hypothetical protein